MVRERMDQLIACAVVGKAAYLATGDADLLDMVTYQDVTMLRAYDFVHLLVNADRQYNNITKRLM
jgi:predicted nucleic acid-binding protein